MWVPERIVARFPPEVSLRPFVVFFSTSLRPPCVTLPGSPQSVRMARLASYHGGAAMTWNLAEAKNRLTEVVNLALNEVPQTITRRNDTVVVISAATYSKLTGKRQSFKDFLMNGPSLEGLKLERDKSPMRDVE